MWVRYAMRPITRWQNESHITGTMAPVLASSGLWTSRILSVSYTHLVHVPADHLIGKENKGYHLAMQILDYSRIGVAAESVGLAQEALNLAVDYAKERITFGKLSSCAKIAASDAAVAVTCDALQVSSGYGYMKDYRIEKLYRDAKLLQIFEGTNQIQRMIVGGYLLRG